MRAHIALVHRALGYSYCLRTHDLGLTYRRSNSFSSLDRALLSLSHVGFALCVLVPCVCVPAPPGVLNWYVSGGRELATWSCPLGLLHVRLWLCASIGSAQDVCVLDVWMRFV